MKRIIRLSAAGVMAFCLTFTALYHADKAFAQAVDNFGNRLEATFGSQNASHIYRMMVSSNVGGTNWSAAGGLVSFAQDTGIAYPYNVSAVNWNVPVNATGSFIVNNAASADVRNYLPQSALGLTYTFATATAQQVAVIPSNGDVIDFASLTANQGIQNTSAAKGDSITIGCAVAGHWTVTDMKGTWAAGS